MLLLLAWSGITLLQRGFHLPPFPTLGNLHFSSEALGFWKHSRVAHDFAILALIIGFGHSVLAMSGEAALPEGVNPRGLIFAPFSNQEVAAPPDGDKLPA